MLGRETDRAEIYHLEINDSSTANLLSYTEMFNQHHHQQQLHQHLRQLQQLLQHQQPPPPPAPSQQPSSHQIAHHHHHQGARPISTPVQAPPPPHMVSLCSTSQATIIAANPMLQGALLMQQMQGNMRGFPMGGQQFAQFFSAGSRPSLLGPAPMGVAIKSPHVGFPPRHFHPHTRFYNHELALRQTERKGENELRGTGNVNGQPGANIEGEKNDRNSTAEGAVASDRQTLPSAQLEGEPPLKRQMTDGSEGSVAEPPEADGALSSNHKSPAEDKEHGAGAGALEQGQNMTGPGTMEFMEESRAPEVVGMGTMLKVTIQQSSESRAFSTGLAKNEAGAGQAEAKDTDGDGTNKFFCYICNTACHNQQNFQSHMNGLAHQQRMMEIQHMSNACLITLLPRVRESLESTHRDGEKRSGLQRWCATCQTHFSGDLIQHRRTKEHKLSKHSSRPFCTVCKRHFRTPRKFVEHMKSPEHKQRVEELREEGLPEVLEELITVDAVGCFEGEEDYEEEPNEEEEGEEEEHGRSNSQGGQTAHREVTLEDMTDEEEYDPDTQYGSSFVVPVAGFLCRLCHKFYHFESTARLSHCQSLTHFQNLQKYRTLRSQEDTCEPDTCSRILDDTKDKKEMLGVTEEVEEKKKEEMVDNATPSPNNCPPELATLSHPAKDRVVRSHDSSTSLGNRSSRLSSSSTALLNLSVTVSRPSVVGERAARGHALEEAGLPVADSPPPSSSSSSSYPLHRDSPEEESRTQAILVQWDPPCRVEEPASREQEEEVEEEGEEDTTTPMEEKPATRRKQASRKRTARTTRRR
ncbi:hypothetical protein AGOR_G00051270 [Albula goreensis]|uniref:Matrin-type domain-containing protein n=1 Tax=Albula goreensis TaxID=1534307 RepID=A0A8T3DT10_9TELE|nr:hypothetical protein AGOR_G00051270 [Albula goreensis]